MTRTISRTDDFIDVRDIIARFEELEALEGDALDDDTREEYAILAGLLDDLKGHGGDEQWCGDWYPGTLVRDSYFKEYAQDLADDLGMLGKDRYKDNAWPFTCIDWEKAARELQMDYSSVEFDGITYWYR